jgi:hypothetical protein
LRRGGDKRGNWKNGQQESRTEDSFHK